MKKFFFLLAALLLCGVAPAQTIQADPGFRTGKLPNGLSYYLYHNENPAGCAEFYIAHNVGALQEEDNQDGLAHFLEHMAFNGTRHYPGSDLLKFLAKEGVSFGYNVNAFTTRRETVYNISVVPLVRESFVDSVLLILHDWSCDISCEPQALDDERGVISEEWRMRDDPRSRMARLQNDLIYKGAKHTQRSVLGSLDVINHFQRQEILDFYHKWYRPDLQAIIIVGDFDVDWMEAKVRKCFADIPMPENAPQKEQYFPPYLSEPLFADMTDNRIKFQAVKIIYKQPYPTPLERGRESFYKDAFCRNIVSSVLSERLKQACQAKDSPARTAILVFSDSEPDYYISLFTVTPRKKELLKESLAFTHREIRRLLQYGISPEEFEVAKLLTAQRYHLDRETSRVEMKSEQVVKVALDHFLNNHPLVNPADMKELQSRVMGTITYEDILPYPDRMFLESEVIYANCYNPQEEPGLAPSAQQMKQALAQVDAENLEPAFLHYSLPDLTVNTPAGSIRKVSKKKGYEIWTLSNGARVYYQPSDPLVSNVHLAMGWRFETGMKTYPQEQITSARLAAGYMGQHLGFRGIDKTEFRTHPGLAGLGYVVTPGRTACTITYTVGNGKEENAFKAAHLTLSEPFFGTPAELEKAKENQLKSLSRTKNPRTAFDEQCNRLVYGNHPWMQELDSTAVEALDMALVEDVFHRSLGDWKNLKLFITSDLDRSRIEDYVFRYVASLDSGYPYEPAKVDEPKLTVKGFTRLAEQQPPQSEPLSHVYYAFIKPVRTDTRTLVVADFLDYILSARYIDLIREARGGAYHVGYTSQVPENPKQPWLGVVQFQTRPDMTELLVQDVRDEMDRLCQDGPTEAEMAVAAKYLVKRHGETEARVKRSLSNQLDRLKMSALWGWDYQYDYQKMIGSIKAADVRRLARKMASGDVLLEVYTEQ